MNKIQKVAVMLVAAAAVASTSQVYALTENWSAQLSRFFTDPSGATGIASGDLVEIGLVSNVAGAQAATSATQLAGFMTVFGSSTIGTGTGIDGSVATASSLTPGTAFFSQQIYILAFNASTSGAATQAGLFTNPAWTFAASDAAAANSMDLGDAGTAAIVGSLATGSVTAPGDIAGTDAAALHSYTIVPEPSTWLLVGTSLLSLLAFRRRS